MIIKCQALMTPIDPQAGICSRFSKTAIVVGKSKPAFYGKGKSQGRLCILYCTPTNKLKGGTKYLLEGNLGKVEFVRATALLKIEFKSPSHRLTMRKMDKAELKLFFNLLKQVHQDPQGVKAAELTALTYYDMTKEFQTRLTSEAPTPLPEDYPVTLENVKIVNYKSLLKLPPPFLALKNLTVLELTNNRIAELPPDMGLLFPNLASLKLQNNVLTWLPSSLSKCPLQLLDFRSNLLDHFPNFITNIVTLRILSIDNNRIKQVSSRIQRLESLATFSANYNLIAAFPFELTKLKCLQTFNFSGNPLALSGDANKEQLKTPFSLMTLKEMSAGQVLLQTNDDISQLSLLPELENFILSAGRCSQCNRLVYQNAKSFTARVDAAKMQSIVTLTPHHQFGTNIPFIHQMCSRKCVNARFWKKKRPQELPS